MAYVGGEGPIDAQLAIVAEKPGREEVQQNRPLVGPTGREVNDILRRIGVPRSSIYLTNVCKVVRDFDNPTTQDILDEQVALYRELGRMPNLNCIVAMGNVALQALSNFHLLGVTNYRGSILQSFIRRKMVPTFHPSYYMGMHGHGSGAMWKWKPVVEFDIRRAFEESAHPHLLPTPREYYVEPTFADAQEWFEYLSKGNALSFDIETRRNFISCIAFSTTPKSAFCIPFCYNDGTNYWTLEQEAAIWKGVQRVVARSGVQYVTQNGLFDCWYLWKHGIVTPYMGSGFDTMYAHRLRAADLPHSLQFLASIYTKEPYYKDESGEWGSDIPVPNKQFWIYNCKDAAVTLEVAHELQEELRECGQLQLFQDEAQRQWDVLSDMRQKGIHVDLSKLVEVRSRLSQNVEDINKRLLEEVGWVPNTKSIVDMRKLFEMLGIKYTTTSKGNPQKDEEHLLIYANQYPKARNVLLDILEINRRRTLLEGFLGLQTDRHAYYHPHYDLGHAKTGRLSSKKADEGGPQLQNIPASIRSIFIPRHEEMFSSCDLKQAEAMVVAWDAQDPLLIDAFTLEKDVHRVRACVIFKGWNRPSLPPDDLLLSVKENCPQCAALGVKKCNHSERYIAKQSGHAFAYMMGIRTFVSNLRQEDIFITEAQAQEIRDRVVSKEIARWQKGVELELRRSPWLMTPLGRKREFYGLLDDEMIRAALSWKAQATVGQITNRAMIDLFELFKEYQEPRPQIVTQTHDSLLVSHTPMHLDHVHQDMLRCFHRPMLIHGRELLIPLELSTGPSWGELIDVGR